MKCEMILLDTSEVRYDIISDVTDFEKKHALIVMLWLFILRHKTYRKNI